MSYTRRPRTGNDLLATRFYHSGSALPSFPATLRRRLATEVGVPEGAILVGIVLIAFGIRASHVLAAPFPLNDGGMFAAAVGDLRANHWQPPQYLSYNHSAIPFAYPPLGFYASALFCLATGASVETSLRVLPLVASLATVPAFWRVAKVLVERRQALLATALFALVPRSWDWEIVGGGLTRSLGFFFALLTVGELAIMRRGTSRKRILLAGTFGGLAILSHLEMAAFVATSGCVLLLMDGWKFERLKGYAAAGMIAALIALPWILEVARQGGFAGLLSASQTGGAGYGALRLMITSPFDEPFFPIFACLVFVGAALAPRSSRTLLVWLLVLYLLDPRKAPSLATVPGAILAAQGACLLFLPGWLEPGAVRAQTTLRQRFTVYGLLIFAGVSAVAAGIKDTSPLRALSAPERTAMIWARTETAPSARFLVISGEDRWALDAVSEWFPELAERTSTATVQGSEWLGKGRYESQWQAHRSIQRCDTAACLFEVARTNDLAFDYILVAKTGMGGPATGDRDCCSSIRTSLDQQGLVRVYEHEGVTVYRTAKP